MRIVSFLELIQAENQLTDPLQQRLKDDGGYPLVKVCPGHLLPDETTLPLVFGRQFAMFFLADGIMTYTVIVDSTLHRDCDVRKVDDLREWLTASGGTLIRDIAHNLSLNYDSMTVRIVGSNDDGQPTLFESTALEKTHDTDH